MLEDEDRALLRRVGAYLEVARELAQQERQPTTTPLGLVISAHLGVDASTLPVVQETIAEHRLIDADIALEILAQDGDGSLIGVSGGEQRMHMSFGELIRNMHMAFEPGPVDYAERATGPRGTRRVVTVGVRLLRFGGAPIAVLQRAASRRHGRESAVLEVVGEDPDAVTAFLARLRAVMLEHSVLRGQILSFVPTQFGPEAGVTFVARPSVGADEVILPDGLLDEVVRHVIGIGEHRAMLQAAGQHLKRGVLLYGPPGTGKTLTVRHLLARTESTVVLLSGPGIRFVTAAAEIARTFPPAIVVLEDIDLVAMERGPSPQPLLFEVLEALDGLDGDADVAFVMTTNRADVLERALAERPGRVDLAVEVPLPGRAERERLYRHYSRGLAFGEEALARSAEETEGVTASFAKELVRRSVLRAAARGRAVSDADLDAAREELMSARQGLTRRVLGGNGEDPGGAAQPPGASNPRQFGEFRGFPG